MTPEDKVIHGVQQLMAAFKNTPASTVDAQLQAIQALQDTIEHWAPAGSLELLKLIINSIIYRPGPRFACFDIKNFYLDTLMERSEYARIKLSVFPQEIIDEYNLLDYEHNWWIYFEIVLVCYGLPQSGRLANNLLHKRLRK